MTSYRGEEAMNCVGMQLIAESLLGYAITSTRIDSQQN